MFSSSLAGVKDEKMTDSLGTGLAMHPSA